MMKRPWPVASLLGLAAVWAACYSFRPTQRTPAEILAKGSPDLRVTLVDGRVIPLTKPRLEGDSLIGIKIPSPAELSDPRLADKHPRVAVAVADVKSTEVAETQAAVSAVGVLGVVALAAAVVAGQSLSSTSCPIAYVWDGHDWRRDSGTFAGGIAEALAQPDVDVLEWVRPAERRLRIRYANERPETDFTDLLQVDVVEHAPGLTLAPDAEGRLHTLGGLVAPRAARDRQDRDALLRVTFRDEWFWESVVTGRDSSRPEDARDGLELVFPRPPGASRAKLVVEGQHSLWASWMVRELVRWHGTSTDAWYDSLRTVPGAAAAIRSLFDRIGNIEVAVASPGGWSRQGVIREAGPEVTKRQLLELDLSQVPGDSVRVRLETTVATWVIDRIAIDYSADQPVVVTKAPLVSARDRAGRDARAVVERVDGDYLIQRPGDRVDLEFSLPAPTVGRARSVVLRSHGWYRLDPPTTAVAEAALLDPLVRDSTVAPRFIVGSINRALEALRAGAAPAPRR